MEKVEVRIYHITIPPPLDEWSSFCEVQRRGSEVFLTETRENLEELKQAVVEELAELGYQPEFTLIYPEREGRVKGVRAGGNS